MNDLEQRRKRRLEPDEVHAIDQAQGTLTEIARRFGISYNTAESIRNGGSHVAITGKRPRGKARKQKRLERWRLDIPKKDRGLSPLNPSIQQLKEERI